MTLQIQGAGGPRELTPAELAGWAVVVPGAVRAAADALAGQHRIGWRELTDGRAAMSADTLAELAPGGLFANNGLWKECPAFWDDLVQAWAPAP